MNYITAGLRAVSFGAYGLKEFTARGFLNASANFTPGALDKDLTGRVAVITGANSGLGKVTALEYARRGGTVHMLCRNQERGEKAREEISKEAKNDKVHLHIVDMSEPDSIRQFASKFKQEPDQRLDVLVNNAGVLLNAKETNSNGFEKSFATNTIGTFLLTNELLPLLKSCPTKPSRLIVVSSGGMYSQPLTLEDINWERKTFDGVTAYAISKRHQVILTHLWGEQLKESGVHVSCMHPGWAVTPGVETSLPGFYKQMQSRMRTVEQGADTIIWLAVSDEAMKHNSGQFFFDRKPVSPHLSVGGTKSTPDQDKKLLDFCEHVTKFNQLPPGV